MGNGITHFADVIMSARNGIVSGGRFARDSLSWRASAVTVGE
jgi:hypothetical protein